MRNEPLWQLLASDNGPVIIGLLQFHLYEEQHKLPASILLERLGQDLEELRTKGDNLPQTAQAYVAKWVKNGYLERHFPSGASEEEYELTTAAVEAIRFLSGIYQPHSVATESRLSLVIQSLKGLADDTDADNHRRIERLEAEKIRIDKEIKSIETGLIRVLPKESALERTREVIALADDLTGDFRRVRDQFAQLNRELLEHILDTEENRSEVLDSLFSGIDLISESEAGRTFTAFWNLLTDPEQSSMFDAAVTDVMSREFTKELDPKERRFLRRLTGILLEQGGAVHEVLQTFARSLKHFVQSREYLEQRRINQLLKEAQHAALVIRDETKVTESIEYSLELTSSRLRSLSQWVLYDPSLEADPEEMLPGVSPMLDLQSVSDLVTKSEIDFRTLKKQVYSLLEHSDQVSISDIFARYPAKQGLGSVIGLLALGNRHGTLTDTVETVTWVSENDEERRARIPKIYFVKERMHELG